VLLQSPMPQWSPAPKPSCTARTGGLSQSMPAGAHPERNQCAPAHGYRCRASYMVWHSTTRQSVNDNKVFSTFILTTPATRRYTHTSTVMMGEGCSPRRRAARQRRSTSTRTNGSEVDEDLRDQLLSCISMPRGLGARRRILPATRSSRESSHRQRAQSLA
jgi:hypothetical protein